MLLYNLFIHIFHFSIKIASFFSKKAQKWLAGRKKPFQQPKPNTAYIWFHCASFGEFEQGRNVMEALKKKYPEKALLITFFSPSGYEVRKNYALADIVMYLPLDTPAKAYHFLETYQPQMAFFVKYDLWLNVIFEAKKRNIPLFLIAARVGEGSSFFRFPMKSLYKKAFQSFSAIFTQDEKSKQLLHQFSQNPNIFVTGDTRYDRVFSNRQEWQPIPEMNYFLGESYSRQNVLLLGSCWAAEIEMMLGIWATFPANVKLIFAPHEIHKTQIAKYMTRFPTESILFSEIATCQPSHRILWVDNVGMLAKMYAYSGIAFVGGGFQKALHNILEPATFSNIVLFGEDFYPEKYPEGAEMIANGGALSVKNGENLLSILQLLIKDVSLYAQKSNQSFSFVQSRIGATGRILDELLNRN